MALVIPLGGGVGYKNFFNLEGSYLGIVEDGKFQDVRQFKEIKRVTDGFNFVGDKEILKINSMLTLKYYSWSLKNLIAGVPFDIDTGSDGYGSFTKYSVRSSYSSSDLLEDITFIGSKYGGDSITISLKNALNIENNTINFNERIYHEVTYVGFYDFSSSDPVVNILE